MRTFPTLILAGLLACVSSTWGQAPPFLSRVWQTSEGLPGNVVEDVAEDGAGYVWLATDSGIARFDGVRFELFSAVDGLPDNRVRRLAFDRAGHLWVGTGRGLAVREKGEWRMVGGLPPEAVTALHPAADGWLWVGTAGGAWRWRGENAERVELEVAVAEVRGFLDDGEGGVWILTRNGLSHADAAARCRTFPGPWSGRELRKIARDRDGRLLIGGEGLLFRQRRGEWEDLATGISSEEPVACLDLAPARDGTLWVATRNLGLVYLNRGRWERHDATNGLPIDDVRCVHIDRGGLVWAGTNGGGVSRLVERPFDLFGNGEGLGRAATSALAAGPLGQVWAGTDGSDVFKLERRRFVPVFSGQRGPWDGLISSMCVTAEGSLWFGTFRNGVHGVDTNGRPLRIGLTEGLLDLCVPALHPARDGGLIIGMRHGGVVRWRDGEIDASPGGPTMVGGELCDVLEDRSGNLWVAAGAAGLWRCAGEGCWQRLDPPGIQGAPVGVVHEGAEGEIWIGSVGAGLHRIHGGKFSSWRKIDGLLSDTIVQINQDAAGNLWLGTDSGLQRVAAVELGQGAEPAGLIFGREDGLPSPQFSSGRGNLSAMTRDGALWFALAGGALRVDPAKLRERPTVPEVRIESAAGADEGGIWHFERDGGIAVVPAGSGTLSIRFTAPYFRVPERLQFRYRMRGLEQSWQTAGSSRAASYGALPPGEYIFEVKASLPGGKELHEPATLAIRVLPHFWQTWPFRIAAAAGVVAVSSLLARSWSTRRLRRKMEVLEHERRVEQERSRIARDLHDELGASLTEINFLGTLLSDAMPEGSARAKIDGMVARAQSMAKSLDEIVWTVNPANDTLSSTAYYLCSRTEESLRAAGIRCRLRVADNLPKMELDSEFRHHLLMAVNEAVNNVMKHSGAEEAGLSIETDDGWLRVTIDDAGKGYDPATATPGRNGITNLTRRMEALGGRFAIGAVPGRGTRVVLEVPLTR